MCAGNSIYESHLDAMSKQFSNASNKPRVNVVTLITTPSWNLQMLMYLEFMKVRDRENGKWVFLWLVSNARISVTAMYVMGICRTDVIVSVFCDARESMEPIHDEW
jgi:hypothetical protein